MENIISFITSHSEIKTVISYFSCELLLLMGVVVNLFLLFFRKKLNVAKISKIITVAVFALSVLALSVIYVGCFMKLDGYGFTLLAKYLETYRVNFHVKLLIDVFLMVFILISFNDVKKFNYKVPILNSIVLLLAICGGLVFCSEKYIATYLLLEAVTILVYKFASNMRIGKFSVFSKDYIVLSLSATVIFLAFYVLRLYADKTIQISVTNICLSIAMLMKIGIFPFYNFLILKPAKTNLPFSLLLFGYLPWIGVMAFNKMSNIIMPTDEVYQISMITFILISLTTFALYASKHKNIIKFLANFSYFINGLCILNIIYFQGNKESIWLSAMFSFVLIGLYSLISIVKNNYKLNKINVTNLKGIFLNNRLFAFLFSGILIMATGLIPNGITEVLLETLRNIYIYDKTGFLAIGIIICLMLLILFNSLKIVQNIYTFEKNRSMPVLAKRTTFNYVVPAVIMIFLILKVIL